MTRFQVGQKVQAHTTAQGLQAGWQYTVVNVDVQPMGMFGDLVTYVVDPCNGHHLPIAIGNGHLLLTGAK